MLLNILAVTLALLASSLPAAAPDQPAAWTVPAPVAAEAAVVAGGQLVIFAREDGAVAMYSAPLSAAGIGAAGEEGDPWGRVPLDLRADEGDQLLSSGNSLLVVPAAGGGLTLVTVSSTGGELASEVVAGPPSPGRVESFVATRDLVVLLGTDGERLRPYAMRRADWGPDATWATGPEVPDDRRGAGLAALAEGFLLLGGTVTNEAGIPVPVPFVYRCVVDPITAQPSGWSMLVQPMRPGPGRARAVSANGAVAVAGDTNAGVAGDRLTSQTLAMVVARGRSSTGPWISSPTRLPALAGAVLATNPATHQVIITGGRVRATGEPWAGAAGYHLPMTQQAAEILRTGDHPLRDAAPEDSPTREVVILKYDTAVRRAMAERRKTLVVFLDDSDASNRTRRLLTRDRHARLMTGELLLASPWEDDMEAAREKTGTEQTPAFALMSEDGHVIVTHEGELDRAGLADFLSPLWGPRAITETGQEGE